MKIGFIGLGNMAGAMIGGMLAKGMVQPSEIVGTALTRKTRERAEQTWGIETKETNREVCEAADVVILAVKPQFFLDVIGEIKEVDRTDKLFVSLAPGKTMAWLEEAFGGPLRIVRCMPNTPALVGEGCTGVCYGEGVSGEEKALVEKILSSCGRAVTVPERLMDVVVGISGSSPAYVFMFIEAMADAAVAEGMPRAQAYELAAQAVYGSAKLMLETGKHPGELKDMVCSPAGTTIQAVKTLEEKNFRGAVIDAVCACISKSRSM